MVNIQCFPFEIENLSPLLFNIVVKVPAVALRLKIYNGIIIRKETKLQLILFIYNVII